MDHYRDLQINSTRWPNFADWVSQMHKNGTHIVLWVPPWRIEPNSNLYKNHPDWVVKQWGSTSPVEINSKYYVLDVTNNNALNYLIDELESLVNTYGIDGFKIDFAFEIADYHSEFANRVIANTASDNMWHRALKEIYDDLHNVKKDIVISQIAVNPLYFDTMDISRLLDDDHSGTDWVNMRIYEFKVLYYSNLTHKGIVADTDWYWQVLNDTRTYTILPLMGPVSIYSSLYKGISVESSQNLTSQDYQNIKAAAYLSKKFPISPSWDFAFEDTIHITVTAQGHTVAKTLDESTLVYYDGTNAYINSFDKKTLKVSDVVSYTTYSIQDLSTGHTLGAPSSFTAEAGHTYEITDIVQQSADFGVNLGVALIGAIVPLMMFAVFFQFFGDAVKTLQDKMKSIRK